MSIMEAAAKNYTFDSHGDVAEEASALLGAMANPKRLMVLCSLLESEKSVGQLTEIAGISQGALSQHLGKLRAMGLVDTRRDAQTIYYRLVSSEAEQLLEVLHKLYCAPPSAPPKTRNTRHTQAPRRV